MPHHKIAAVLQKVWPATLWHLPNDAREVYLTFDDGPTPGVTDVVLDLLKAHQAQATFFVIGKNVAAHPDLYQRILAEGHTVGHHTMHHLRGWNTPDELYLQDVQAAADLVDSQLFRPPYGRIKPSQVKALAPHFRIVMWSLLTKDYDAHQSHKKIARRIKRSLQPGSIVVFHDSLKAKDRLFPALEFCLQECAMQQFKPLGIPVF
jgi:peptidoglycan/xylan/chitin deacetylase (PgdA/CDA1 family)